MSMNPDIRARWTAWLRANADKQTTGRLNRTTTTSAKNYPIGFCCLGGLCELAVADGIIEARLKVENQFSDYGLLMEYGKGSMVNNSWDWSDTSLPKAVYEWAGLTDPDPAVDISDGERVTTTLTGLNDDYRYTFDQIADIIDAQL